MEAVALVVDDDPGAREVLGAELKSAGFSVREAEDGIEGWKSFSEHAPDLVVTDLRMPHLDGLGLIRRIRSDAHSWVPVIVITSHQGHEILNSVFEAGQGAATHFLHLRRDLHRLAEVARGVLEVDVQQLRERRRNLRYHHLRRALQECDGVISQVAERMGTDRKTVYYHLKKFGLYKS
jgi:DNA-binding NtrC family response regulator